jgi:hypothetical protein
MTPSELRIDSETNPNFQEFARNALEYGLK